MANASQTKAGIGPYATLVKVGPKLLGILTKVGKVLFSSKVVLAAASFAGYSLLLSWKFALVLLGSIFFHEMGHISAMRKYGLRVKGVYFLPFMGAAAVYEGPMPSRKAQVVISLMGPLWGFGLALACYGLYGMTHAPILAALAGWMAMINLFNLLPINPLDGGKTLNALAHSISSRLGVWCMGLGLVLGFVLALKLGLALLWLLIIVGAMELYGERREVRNEAARTRVLNSLAAAMRLPAYVENICETLEEYRLWNADVQKYVTDSALWAYADSVNPRKPHMRKELARIGFEISGDQTGVELTYDYVGGRLVNFLRSPVIPRMTRLQAVGGGLAYAGLAAALVALLFATRHVPGADIALSLFTH